MPLKQRERGLNKKKKLKGLRRNRSARDKESRLREKPRD
jgi:hypothetical protein